MSERPRLLVVEDEPLVLMDLTESLTALGYCVADKADSLARGLVLARELTLDGAVLDVNLGRDTSAPIADVLCERGVPFLLVTGSSSVGIPERYRSSPRLEKPFVMATLERALEELISRVTAG